MSEPIAPAPATLNPQPSSWSHARSFRSINGMSNDEKFNLQTCLRELCDTYLDPTKLWNEQNEKLRDQVVEKACAQCPYVRERYEGAWPIEAWLRSRLSSSKSTWRRKSEQPSRKPRPKPKAKAKTAAGPEEPKDEDALMEGQGTQDTKDDMDAEVDELVEDDEAAPMEIAPSEADPFEGSSQDVNQALAEICSMGLPSITTSPTSSDATRVALRSSPAPQNPPPPPKQTAKRTPARKPRIPAPSASQPSTSTPCRTAVAKKPRLSASTKKSQKALETRSGQMDEPTPSQGTDAKVVRRFLESLAQPLPNLLPRFIAHGVLTASSLRALTVIGDKELDGLLREDLKLNSFETRIVRDGLERLVK